MLHFGGNSQTVDKRDVAANERYKKLNPLADVSVDWGVVSKNKTRHTSTDKLLK